MVTLAGSVAVRVLDAQLRGQFRVLDAQLRGQFRVLDAQLRGQCSG